MREPLVIVVELRDDVWMFRGHVVAFADVARQVVEFERFLLGRARPSIASIERLGNRRRTCRIPNRGIGRPAPVDPAAKRRREIEAVDSGGGLPPPSVASVGIMSAKVIGESLVFPADMARPARNERHANAAFVQIALDNREAGRWNR